MTGSDNDGPSFDPRTWGAAKAPPSPGPKPTADPPSMPSGDPGATSFDPKTWSTPKAGQSDAAASAAPASSQKLLIGAAVGVGALAAVVGGIILLSPHRPRSGAASATSAPVALAAPPGTSKRSLILAGPGDIEGALVGAGVAPDPARQAAQAATHALGSKTGDLHLAITLTPGGGGARLLDLEARRDDGTGVTLRPSGAGFVAQADAARLASRIKVVRGEMDANSLYSSAVAAGVTDSLIAPFAQAFTFDFDFQREIKQGDIFEAAWEQKVDDAGQVVGAPRLVFALLETAAKSRALYRFQPAAGAEGWFDSNGRSIVRALMRTPVEGARISSTFGMREHPILGFMKLHKGIDFASPVGTPIYAAGDGVIEFAGPKGPNGNFVQIRHINGWETLYLHMNAFGPGVITGAPVRQGQQIGEVGTTGRSTGPHLHYEVHIGGEAVDPASIRTDEGRALSGADLQAFKTERDRIDALRSQQTGN
jgi:murein DD-endopeptidase MepM/ murein hydrolase activator NlpD